MARVLATHVPMVRLYNGVVYAISAVLYSVVLFVLEVATQNRSVFVPNSSNRTSFLNLSLLSWVLLGVGSLVLLALYFPVKSRKRPGLVEAPRVALLALAVAFGIVMAGLVLSVAVSVFVFLGSRERALATTIQQNTVRVWVLPIFTGIVPAVFFFFMAISLLRSMLGALRDFSTAKASEGRVLQSVVVEDSPVQSFSAEEAEKVERLQKMGYRNRGAVIAALEASGFNLERAESRLAHVRN